MELRRQRLKDTRAGLACFWFLVSSFCLVSGFCLAACHHNPDVVRKEHGSSKKPTIYDDGALAGRVVFAAGGLEVPASGANIIIVDTASGKQVLEHLQKEVDKPCMGSLTDMENFLLDAAKTSAQAGRTPPTGTADTDGYFLVPRVKPGAYLVVAYGRAGDTQAIWEQPTIIQRYQAVTVKMLNPLISCSASEQK